MNLRPHHLLCIQNYTGHGYDDRFIRHMDSVIKILFEDPGTKIRIADGPDELCSYCPNLTNGRCASEEKVRTLDRQVLQALPEIKDDTWQNLAEKSRIILTDSVLFNEVCGDCEWKKLCDSHHMKGGSIIMNTNTGKTKELQTLDIVYIAFCAALITVLSWINIPAVVPFTLQTFAVFCVLGLIGGKRGTLAVVVYILMGVIGLPVFTGFIGGIGIVLGTTGGYIIGFIFIGLIYWLMENTTKNTLPCKVAALLIGLLVCYAFGTAWFMIVYTRQTGPVGIAAALSWCVIPFIIPDIIKLALAVFISKRLRKVLNI